MSEVAMSCFRPAVVTVVAFLLLQPATVGAQAAADSSRDAAVAAAVKRELAGRSDLRRLTVSVSGSQVTLTGQVQTLWLKMDAVKRALKVDGVKTVVSEIELPKLESDINLALHIRRAIDDYPHNTIFDYFDALIRNGVVTLKGSVTSDGRNKAEEMAEEIAKVRGVHEIRNEIVTLPASIGDDNIRAAIINRVFSSLHFEGLSTANPPFRIVVHNGTVSLYGYVQSEVEYRELESIVRFTSGVLGVNNHLQTITKPR